MKTNNLETMRSLQIKAEKSFLRVYVAHRKDLNEIILKEVPAQNYWTVDTLRSPVIELDRCFFDGKIIRRGRLFYDAGYYDDSGKWTGKSTKFVEWATEIFKLIKKSAKRNAKLGAYFGMHAEKWLSKAPGAVVD